MSAKWLDMQSNFLIEVFIKIYNNFYLIHDGVNSQWVFLSGGKLINTRGGLQFPLREVTISPLMECLSYCSSL